MSYIIQFLCLEFSLIISPVPANSDNPFSNKIFFNHIFQPIVDDGLYIFSEHVLI